MGTTRQGSTSTRRRLRRRDPTGQVLVPIDGVLVSKRLAPYLLELQRRSIEVGIGCHLISGYRTAEEQRELGRRYLMGAPDVLRPPVRFSLHRLGLAVDIESDDLEQLGEIAEAIGLRWGGRQGDPVHFDLGR